MIYRLLHADVMDGLRKLADESVQCIVTSPPYWGLRDYGIEPSVWGGDAMHAHEWGGVLAKRAGGGQPGEKQRWQHTGSGPSGHPFAVAGAFCECGTWLGCFGLEPTPELFVEHAIEVFREARRVLKNDGTLWLNLGDSYASGGGAGTQGSTGQRADRRHTQENLRTRGSRAGHEGKHGYSGASQDGPNRATVDGLKPKDLVGIPWAVAFALRADGWYLRSDIVWHKPNPMPESVTDRPTKAHEYLFLLSKSPKYLYDADAIKEPMAASMERRPWLNEFKDERPEIGSTARTNGRRGAIAKGNAKTFRGGGSYTGSRSFDNAADAARESHGNEPNASGMRNKRSVWTVATAPFAEAHFATFPPDLIEPCILAGSRIGDMVLDMFNGAGTTGVVALSHQRDYVGIDRNGEYVEMSRRRLRKVAPMFAKEIAS